MNARGGRWWRVSLVGVALVTTCASAAGARPMTATAVPRVLVIGVPGLRWEDVTPGGMPAVSAFCRRAAVGALSVKAAALPTRATAGWLTLGAGNRVTGVPPSSPTAPGGPGTTLRRARLANAHLSYGAQVGALGTALRAAGRTTRAVGGAGAELAIAPAGQDATRSADLVVVSQEGLYGASGSARPRAAAAVDRAIGPLLTAAPTVPGRSTLLVGVSDGLTGGPHLHVAAAVGPGLPAGSLVSASTRRPPYVQLIDVAPTILAVLGVPEPASMVGTPWRTAHAAGPDSVASARPPPSPARLADLDRQARAGLRWAGPFQTALVWLTLALTAATLTAARRPGRWARRWARAIPFAGYTLAALPVASYLLQLVPWWRVPATVVLLPAAAVATGGLAAAAARRWPGGGVGLVTAVTAGVLAVDLLTGGGLQTAALLGDSPLIAGRFVGIGNLAFALLAGSALLLAGLLAGWQNPTRAPGPPRRRALVTATAIAASTLALVGAPQLGDDAGGVLALVPAAGVLLLRLGGRRIRLRTAAALALAGGLVLGALAVADYTRPPDVRTHLGRFVDGVLHGGPGGTALRRHLLSAADSLVSSPFNLTLLGLGALALACRSSAGAGWRHAVTAALRTVPGLLDGLLAATVAVTLGGLVNDSGVAVPGVAACLLLPLILAISGMTGAGEDVPAGPGRGGHGNAGVLREGKDVSAAAAHSPTSAARSRPRQTGASAATGAARYQT